MKRWLGLGIGVGAVALSACTNEASLSGEESAGTVEQPIIGGSDASITDYPWQVYIQAEVPTSGAPMYLACGGSIVAPRWVLSAQHCIANIDVAGEFTSPWLSPRHLLVGAGFDDWNTMETAPGTQVRTVAEYIPLSGYTGTGSGNRDAVLLRVYPPFDMTTPEVQQVKMIGDADASRGLTNPGVTAKVTGWGTMEPDGTSGATHLQQLDVPIVPNTDATAAWGIPILDDQIAAGSIGQGDGTSVCHGDSGGPLVVPKLDGYKLAGIVSWGDCANPAVPDIYGRVSSIKSWVAAARGSRRTPLVRGTIGITLTPGAYFLTTNPEITIPAGATEAEFELRNGSGNMDLYVAYDRDPAFDSSSDDCYSGNYESNEYCPIHNPTPGTWRVGLYVWADATDVSVLVSYRLPVAPSATAARAVASSSPAAKSSLKVVRVGDLPR